MESKDKAQAKCHAIMWAAFLTWALKQPELRDEFKADTGIDVYGGDIDIATNGKMAQSEQMDARMRAFVKWATVKHYGLEYAPQSYRDEVAASTEAANG